MLDELHRVIRTPDAREDVVAHDVVFVPVDTVGGQPAELVETAVGPRWIGTISSWERAARAWPSM